MMAIKKLRKHKNTILISSVLFALFVMIVATINGWWVLMYISLGYMLFMLINNWSFVVGEKDEVDELLDAQEDFQMIHIFRRES